MKLSILTFYHQNNQNMNSNVLKLTLQNKIKPYSKCIQNLSQQDMRTVLRSNYFYVLNIIIVIVFCFFRLYIMHREPKHIQRTPLFGVI